MHHLWYKQRIDRAINRARLHHSLSPNNLEHESWFPGVSLDYFTVLLHSPNSEHLPDAMAVQGDCQWSLKKLWNYHQSCEPIMHCNWGNPNLYFDPPITKGWCQPLGGKVSYPTGSRTGPGLGSSLRVNWIRIEGSGSGSGSRSELMLCQT